MSVISVLTQLAQQRLTECPLQAKTSGAVKMNGFIALVKIVKPFYDTNILAYCLHSTTNIDVYLL